MKLERISPIEDTVGALAALVADGKVRYIQSPHCRPSIPVDV